MNKRRILILLVLALGALLLVGTALAQEAAGKPPQDAAAPGSPAVLAGGSYTLVVAPAAGEAPAASAPLQGGAYQLQPDAPTSPNAGPCCCLFLPCVRRK